MGAGSGSDSDRRFMSTALGLGARGLGRVWPNPAVGCVIVQGGVVVGRGWTQPGGRPHAEAVALAQAGAAARGATVYVTLEPCAHHGKTPPCAEALVAAGVARVVSALTDPDGRVAGRGLASLRAAGIEVTEGVLEDEARVAQAGFLSRILRGRPMVTLKLALTLDGRIALADGTSRWITGAGARRAVHRMRADHDAVLVGAGTLRADDPDLRVRDLGTDWQPVRVVADTHLSLRPDARLMTGLDSAPVWLLHAEGAPGAADWQARGVRTLACAPAPGGMDPAAMLSALGHAGITRVLCEGGGVLAASLLRAGLVDRLAVFSAGHVFGEDARAGVGDLARAAIGAPGFQLAEVRACGGDLLHLWHRAGFPADLGDDA
jgi:diaminohydroxyphosphoribosylaminopyrimidine deaminase / 5-amino-6-(5-phosphoribosylamino)uracil reductase